MTGRFGAPVVEMDRNGLVWHRSSRCNPDRHPTCVEAAFEGHAVYVRDSKASTHGELCLRVDTWSGFLRSLV